MSLHPYFYPQFEPSFLEYFTIPVQDLAMSEPIHISDYYRKLHSLNEKGTSKFQICLDVHQFAPHEINVKTIGRQIVVEAKHEEKRDQHGYVYRQFVRKYTLPQGHDPNDVVSSLSSDGVLTVTAPHDPIILPDKNERIVPILHTGPANAGVREHKVEHIAEEKPHLHHHHKDKKEENAVPLAIKYV